jgi:dipeptidyl aminopeptidase/acylaminoacyl peptidase
MNRIVTMSFLTLGLAACAATSSRPAPAPESAHALIPREAIFGNPERAQGRISPDGSRVSWLAPRDGVMNVWVAPTNDLTAARAITNDGYRGIRMHFWSPSSRFIYYLQDEGGNENYHVYAAEVATGVVTDLTPVKAGVRATVEGISRERPNEILVGLNDRNPQLFDLYRVQVESGERELVRENPGYVAWLIDNQLTPRFGIQQVAGGGAEVVDFDGKVLYAIPAEDFLNSQPVGFNAANDRMYMVTSKGRDTAALVAVDTNSGGFETLAATDAADIGNVMQHPTTYEPIAYSYEYLKTEWVGMTERVQADIEWLRAKLPGELALVSATDDLSRVVVHADAAEAPGVFYLFDRTAKTVTKLFATRPALAAAELQPMQALQITSRDGLELVSYLTLPPGADADRDGRPEVPQSMVLAVHGGPWARDSYGYHPWHQWLANRGHAVLSVNYRGSSGFGKKFTNAAIKEFAGRMHDDLIDAVRWAVDEKIAAADKIAIAGGSYGGYATLVGVTFTPDEFACGVDIVGPSSLATLIESFPAYWKPFLEGTWFKFVGDPSDPEDRADMISRSAISRVDAIKVPLLIGQGQNDPRVTKKESDQLVEVMKKKGLPATYVNFPDEGHGFVRPENRLAFYAVMEGFLGRCLGGRSAPFDADAFAGSTVQVLEGADWVPGLGEALAARGQDGGGDSGN